MRPRVGDETVKRWLLSIAELDEGIASLRNLPDDRSAGDGKYRFPICPKCHMGFNIPGHIDTCDGSRPFETDLICDGPHDIEHAEENYRKFMRYVREAKS